MTLMSRFTLFKKVQKGEFPAPIGKVGKMQVYDEAAVKDWVKDNCVFVQHRQKQKSCTVDLLSKEIKYIRKAAEILDCDVEPFIIDAATWKAKKVLEAVGQI